MRQSAIIIRLWETAVSRYRSEVASIVARNICRSHKKFRSHWRTLYGLSIMCGIWHEVFTLCLIRLQGPMVGTVQMSPYGVCRHPTFRAVCSTARPNRRISLFFTSPHKCGGVDASTSPHTTQWPHVEACASKLCPIYFAKLNELVWIVNTWTQ